MKLLLASDLHCDREAAQSLVRRSAAVDVVVIAGDFGNARRGLAQCIEILQAIDRPTVVVAGNNESTPELQQACANWPAAVVLHGIGTGIDRVPFFGLGGGIPVTPFGSWSYDFTEEEATSLLQDCPSGGVLVSHSPPQGVLDQSSRGTSLGSRAVRQTILDRQPRLVVCGHIHASGGQQEMLGETLVVNAGPAGLVVTL